MKHLIFLSILFCGILDLKAQRCNHAESNTALLTDIISKEDMAQSGVVKYYLKLKAFYT